MNTLGMLWHSTVGKKAVMAITGGLLFVWLSLHIAGNLLVFSGPVAIDGYSAMLHSRPALLWLMRAGLLLALALHGVAAVQLTRRAAAARPVGYHQQRLPVSTLAARTMRWSGGLLLGFIVFHLLHLTVGAIHATFRAGAVYHNLITGLAQPAIAITYISGVSLVALHLWHGLGSARRSLGWVTVPTTSLGSRLATAVALLVWLGFVVVPLAVLAGGLR